MPSADPHCHIGRIWWKRDELGRAFSVPLLEHNPRPGWLLRAIADADAAVALWPEGLREQTPAARYRRMKDRRHAG